MAIYEAIYAYLYKRNYTGDVKFGQQIYTLTENCGSSEVSAVTAALQTHGDVWLDHIDMRDGVMQSGEPKPDYGYSALSYIPDIGGKAVISRIVFRQSLKQIKNNQNRGERELIHAVMTDELPRGVYAVDCAFDPLFAEHSDIPLESIDPVTGNLTETVPEQLKPIDRSRFKSEPIDENALDALGRNAFGKLSALFAALFAAKREGKTLYIVHNPDENALAVSYIRAMLKLLPVRLANSVSFATANGNISGVRRDICGVPTCDDNTIAALKRDGYVVQLHVGGMEKADVTVGAFAAFFARAERSDVSEFLKCAPSYYDCVNGFSDLDTIMTFFTNKHFTSEEERDGKSAVATLGGRVKTIADNFDLLSRIRGEITEQVTALSDPVELCVGEFFGVVPDEVLSSVVLPLAKLYKKCAALEQSVCSDIMRYISALLFGYYGQNEDCKKKHYRMLMNFNKVSAELGGAMSELVKQMQNDVDGVRAFFGDFFANGDYSETAKRVAKELLKILLGDIDSRYGDGAALRNTLLESYVDYASMSELADAFDMIFRSSADKTTAFEFVRDIMFADRSDAARHADKLRAYADYLKNAKLLELAVKFFCEEVSGGDGHDGQAMLSQLLPSFIPSRGANTIDGMFARYDTLLRLIDDVNATQGVRLYLLDDFATRIINPNYHDAVRAVNADNITAEQKRACNIFMDAFGADTLCQTVDKNFAEELASLLNRHEKFVSQSELEGRLISTRIEFIVRELLLLDGKTVNKLLKNHIDGATVNEVYKKYNVSAFAPYKSERFIDAAEELARTLLTRNEKPAETTEYVEFSLSSHRSKTGGDKKAEFITAVKKERDNRNVDFRIAAADALRRLGESLLVSGVMFVLAAIACAVLYKYYEGGYFMSVFFAFPVLALVVGQVLYWYNAKENKTRNPLAMTAWQSLVVTAAMLGIYVLMRVVLSAVY